jgi:hypothetical protein
MYRILLDTAKPIDLEYYFAIRHATTVARQSCMHLEIPDPHYRKSESLAVSSKALGVRYDRIEIVRSAYFYARRIAIFSKNADA